MLSTHKLGIQTTLPTLYLSHYIVRNKADYYRLLNKVTSDQAWEAWVLYLLEGVTQTANMTTAKIAAVRELRTQVGIPDRSDLIRREDHEALTAAAVAECMDYPVPRLLDEASTLAILNQITD
mgnify:CR=1 FL=1